MPQSDRDWLAYQQHRQNGGKDKDFAARLGILPNNFHRWKQRHRQDLTSNGNLPAIPSAHPIASQRISALPVHSDASALDDVRSRLATLEAFMSALQEQQRISALPAHPNAPAHRSAPERIEPPQWVSRGMHVSTDMLAAIDAYATQRRLEKRMALDELLRIAFAAVAEEVRADE